MLSIIYIYYSKLATGVGVVEITLPLRWSIKNGWDSWKGGKCNWGVGVTKLTLFARKVIKNGAYSWQGGTL